MSSLPETSESTLIDQSQAISPAAWALPVSLGGSLFMHLTALGLMAALILPGAGTSGGGCINGSFGDSLVDEGGFSGSEVSFLSELEASPPAGNPAAEDAVQTRLTDMAAGPMDIHTAAPDLDPGSTLELSERGIPGGSLSDVVKGKPGKSSGTGAGVGSGKGTGVGKGNGSGKGIGNGTGSGKGSFFGLNVKGKSTVFVVDSSRSMNMPHPGPMRTRFNRVKQELVRTISAMTEKEKFFIIFFSDGAYPMPAERVVEAEPVARKRYLQWMAASQPGGQTYPEQALLLALQLEPDVIYFLTDGEFDYSVVPRISAVNVTGTEIHTIGFSDNRGENLLLEMARLNNGTYTYIPPDEPASESEDAGESAASIISVLGK